MKKIIIGLLLCLSGIVSLRAVPAAPYLMPFTQPDGSVVNVYLRGDEFFSYLESEDGYLLSRTASGFIEYARVNADFQIVPLGVKATRPADRTPVEKQFLLTAHKIDFYRDALSMKHVENKQKSLSQVSGRAVQKSYPLKGSPKSLVILANFSDIKFSSSTAQKDYTRLLNEKDYSDFGGYGSAKDFFEISSNGVFSPEFVVVGPYDLPQPCEYYGAPSGGENDIRAHQMIVDACKAASNDIDFSEYDTDKDGKVDNVFVYYAGHNQAEHAPDWTIWPHRHALYYDNLMLDGVKVFDYACTSELRGMSGTTRCGIGTFCHEFGHVLGLPDFYATNDARHPTLGTWDIMDQGSYNNAGCSPPTYSSYERYFLGWLTPELLSEEKLYSLPPLVTSNKAYIVSSNGKHPGSGQNPSPAEFFMIENRRAIGMDSYAVPAEGLLVSHVVYSVSSWNSNGPNNDPNNMGVEIVCASGTTASPSYNVYPGRDEVRRCNFVLRDGTRLQTPLTEISESGENTLFKFGVDPNAPTLKVVDENIPPFEAYFGETKPIHTVEIQGKKLTGSVQVLFKNTSRSEFRMRQVTEDGNTEFSWSTLYIQPEADSTLDIKIEIMFDPSKVFKEPVKDEFRVRHGDIEYQIPIVGYSREPITVYPPKAYEPEGVSPYSFKASWSKVPTASGYYLTVYNIVEKESEQVEQFNSYETKMPLGWRGEFKSVNLERPASKPTFVTDEDTLWSKEYFMPVDKLTFVLDGSNTKGTFIVDALDADGKWVNVKKETCGSGTRNLTVFVTFDAPKYKQFRMYYQKESSEGNITLDDFTAYFSKEMQYPCDNLLVTDTICNVANGLASGVTYSYFVRAMQIDADKTYEYVSDPSNEVTVTTKQGTPADSRELTIVRDADGSYKAYVPDVTENSALFIYTPDGRKVVEIPATSSEFVIPRLVNGEVYILKYAERGHQKRKTKVGKLFYQE